MFDSLLGNFVLGFSVALSLNNLFYCFLGVTLGTFLGILPGIGTLIAVSLLFPVTFQLQPTEALIMLAGIFYGTNYGGSTASILFNLPGTPANAVACLDGYPMSRQGRGGIALFMTAAASFFGATVGILIMMFFAPVLAFYALRFGSPEYFSLMLLGLVAATTVSDGNSPVKGISMVVLGISFGLIGIDVNSGMLRFTFGIHGLVDGVSLVVVAMGLFGVSEMIASLRSASAISASFNPNSTTLRSMIPTRDDVRRSRVPMIRGSAIGSFFGVLPGAGSTIPAFVAYAVEKRASREPERFGKGAIEGLVAPETANNAADQTGFIPTLTLGIPGSAAMALMLGVLMIHGISPGPRLMTDAPDLFWGLVMSFWIGNIMLLVLNIPAIGLWLRFLSIPYHLLYPAILVLMMIGCYTVSNSVFDIWMLLVFGIIGYAMRLLEYPMAPFILGFVLGPMMEENFRRSLVISKGDMMIFMERPISGTVMVVTFALLAWTVARALMNLRRTDASVPN